jgi:type I restriction enzyme S subunit
MMTRQEVMEIAAKARAGLKAIYGERLRGVYLFGSWARGEGNEDSDVDIAVVLDEVPNSFIEIERTGDLFSTLGLDAGVLVSRVFIPEQDFRAERYALYGAVQREGVAI